MVTQRNERFKYIDDDQWLTGCADSGKMKITVSATTTTATAWTGKRPAFDLDDAGHIIVGRWWLVVFHIQYCGYKSELHGFIFIAVRTATMTTYCYICITQVPPNVLSFTRSNEFESPRPTTVQTPSANRSPIAIIVEYTRSDHVDGLLYRSMVEERTSQAMEEDRRVWGRWTTLEAIRKENPWRSWWWWWSPLMNYIIIIVVGGSFLCIQSLYSI